MKTALDNSDKFIHIDIQCPTCIDEETNRVIEVAVRGATNGSMQFTKEWNNTRVYSWRAYRYSEKMLVFRVQTPVGFPQDRIDAIKRSVGASAVALLTTLAGWSMSEARDGVRIEMVALPVVEPTVDPIANMISNIDAAIGDVKDMADLTKTVCIDEAEQLRRENAALRETVARLRHTYEATRRPAKVHIILDVSEGLSTTCLERLQDDLSKVARTILMLDKGPDSRPVVTCKINVPAPKSSISCT